MLNKMQTSLQKVKNSDIPFVGKKNNISNTMEISQTVSSEYQSFYNLGVKQNLPEFARLKSEQITEDFVTTIFLKYTTFRDKFVRDNFSEYDYLRDVEDLENNNLDMNYFLTLDYNKKEILSKKKMLLLKKNNGEMWLGIYYPNVYIDFAFDKIFIFGNNVYNYFFGKAKDLTFLESTEGIDLENILQTMESMGINDIGIDPINTNQYIVTAEISKKNVLLTERPLLKNIIDDVFHSAMTKMNIDSTTEFPTTTGLLKIDLIGQNGLHVKRTFRINFIKVKMGYTASIRKFMNYDEIENLGLKGLGYTEQAQILLDEAIADKSGINMILGETNSGKSTLLAAILNKIYLNREKIISIENPIEIEMPYLQIDLSDTETADEKFKMTKEIAQKGILRHNPNVVLMSEIRSNDEIDFFAGLGLRGHMALATLHAGSVENAIEILLKVADESEIKSILNLFVHQELLAKKCVRCNGTGFVGENKCNVCDGNKSKGVIPIYEIMKFESLDKDDSLKNLPLLIEQGKIKHISKKHLAEEYYENGLLFEEDYRRLIKKG